MIIVNKTSECVVLENKLNLNTRLLRNYVNVYKKAEPELKSIMGLSVDFSRRYLESETLTIDVIKEKSICYYPLCQTKEIVTMIFAIVFYLILKRKEYSCISIRSPTLLLFNNFGGFLLTTIQLIYYIYISKKGDTDFYKLPVIYYIAEILMMGAFFMRCQRIITTVQTTENEQYDKDEFSKKRHLYGEKRFVRLLFMGAVLFAFLMVVVVCISYNYSIPNMLYNESDENKNFRLSFFIIFQALILFTLITYTYFLILNEPKHQLILEAIAFTAVFFIFMNFQALIDIKHYGVEDGSSYRNYSLLLCLIIFYVSLGLNGYFPVILSYCYKTSIAYHFNPQLMNNLYLFLSNEECYGNFCEYIKDDEEASFHLRVYTHIMKFKLEYLNEENPANAEQEAREILDTYFKHGVYASKFDPTTQERITKLTNEGINQENTNSEMFDPALKFSFEQLSNKFLEFKNTVTFDILKKNLAMQSYIQCKMSNTGLINKF